MATKSNIARRRGGTEANSPLSVAEEMEAIFAPLPRGAVLPDTTPPPTSASVLRRRVRWPGILLGIAMLLGAALLLAWVARYGRYRDVPKPVVPPSHLTAARPIVPASPPPAAPAPIAAPQQAVETPHPEVIAAEQRATSPKVAARLQRARVRGSQHGAAGQVRHRAEARGCGRGATSAWCLRGAVLAADDRLRTAYGRAAAAGVDRRILIGIRSDWKRLRGRATHDPQALIRGYALLTQELRAETGRLRRQ